MAGGAGQYNEQVFKAIDFILNEMGKQGIKVIVALVDYWKKTDGVQQVGIPSTCPTREMTKQGIKVIVALVNYWKKNDGVQHVGSLALSHSRDD